MTEPDLTRDEREHSARIQQLADEIEPALGCLDPVLRSAVLATMLARFLADYPQGLRNAILADHLALVGGLVECFDMQATGRQPN